MTTTDMTRSATRGADAYEREDRAGRLVFAAAMLGIAGIMRMFDAIWAFRYDGAVPDHLEKALLGHSLDTYGWFYLVVAAVLIVTSVLVMMQSTVARWIGIFAAAFAAVTAVFWMPYYPIWSFMYVGLSTVVIWALSTGDADA